MIVVLDLPDNKFDDVLTFTAVGVQQTSGKALDVNVTTKSMDLHKVNYMRIRENGSIEEESVRDYSALEDDLK